MEENFTEKIEEKCGKKTTQYYAKVELKPVRKR